MADFHQTGCLATLHRLCPDGTARIEAELRRGAESRPIGLALPALYSEFRRPAMRRIVNELAGADYLRRIVVAVGRASRAEFDDARRFFDGFPAQVSFLWIDSPGIQELLEDLQQEGLGPGPDGKGRSCWLAYGYLLAAGDCEVIAVHDCDIVNYDRAFLARLCYPVANPDLGFDFAKGYYARVSDRLHGRVTRLFMAPLIRAAAELAPGSRWLRFLGSFRYCLSGEFAMRAELARVNRIPADWGLEVGVLAEVYRNCAPRRICQVDLADNYEHKHQPLSQEDPGRGLRRMAADIARAMFRSLYSEGAVFTRDHMRALQLRYVQAAREMIDCYRADALINGLGYDRNEEELAVAAFGRSLSEAAADFLENPLGDPEMPNWDRAVDAVPDVFERLLDAAETGSELARCQVA